MTALPKSRWTTALVAPMLALGASATDAQSIEPRSFSNAPVGVNFLVVGYAYTSGGLSFDASSPVTDPKLETSSVVVAYARTLDFFGTSAKFDVIAPYTWLSGSARYLGGPIRRDVDGAADPLFRLSVNLYGAPALSLAEYRAWRQDVIVGASLQVSAPVGQYDPTKLVNLGTNRWTFKPEVGVSKAIGQWTLEFTAAATLVTDNDDFFGGQRREQDPVYAFQGHAIYNVRPDVWLSVDATYFTGGRTTIDGTLNNDLQQNWRVGATFALPLDVHNSIKLYASSGVSARTGNNFDLVGVAWQYRWGGGL